MGANLVGYMVVGPKVLTGDRDLIIARTSARLAAVQKYLDAQESSSELWPLLPDLVSVDPCFKDTNLEWEDMERLLDLNPETVVNDLFDLWERGASDASSRVVGDKLVVFAGTTTWGDEPSSWGYETLRDADQLGILNDLGIE